MFKILIGLSVSIASTLFITPPASAASDYGCYMQTGSMRIVDLTRSVCGFNATQAAKDAKKDTAYLKAVRKMFQQNPYGSSSFKNLIEANPEALTSAARNYCQARQSGKSDEEIMQNTYRDAVDATGIEMNNYSPKNRQEAERLQQQMEVAVIPTQFAMSLASKHYCPQVSSRSLR
ncbi:MAG: hypothetical protein LH660_08905 [Phormidesmis sp. CAN_BIN36]|nr:hypothetical protein [Phormidesmis sp. CAN_BIN36]